MMTVYDRIGRSYRTTRKPDPRIAAQVATALSGVTSVVNVGAGAGSYEPAETLVAVEPSSTMIEQRPAASAACVRGVAEALPLRDGSVDAALAVLTVHHWTDVEAGIAELRRVARKRIVILSVFDCGAHAGEVTFVHAAVDGGTSAHPSSEY